ncbi:uncharacterized protein [Hetaerina americana]|uniref:uncharacterized protein n=1 Tax=Hetaerina americana TaxID=62018 RepID=UPI003A7F37F9
MDPNDGNLVAKRCVKMTKKQAAILVDFMETHQDFACGRYESPERKTIMTKMWNELKGLLDMHGAPKTLEQWRRAWKDLRAKTRAKNARLLAERSTTGYDEDGYASLSNLEQRVLEIIGATTTAPAHKPPPNFETSLPVRVKCVSSGGNVATELSVSKTPTFQQFLTRATMRSTSIPQQTVISKKPDDKAKVILTNDRLDDILSKLESYRAESLDLMKVIANGIATIAEGQRDILTIQKERLEFQREVLRLERMRVENEVKMKNVVIEISDCQRRMASAQEPRAFCDLDGPKI